MATHQTYLSYIIADPNWQKFATAVVVGGGLVVLGAALTSRLRGTALQEKIVPQEKLGLFGFFDMFIEGLVGFHDSILGPENRKHLPFIGTLFLFIFLSNVLGLIPGVPALTTTVWVNLAMALVVFTYFNWQGVKANGWWGYLKHFGGPVWWLAFIVFPVEVISTCLRVFTLNLRLYWNITADHIVLGIFSDLVPYIVPIPFYLVGTFVSFMQAFIFSTLTMIYILLATQHEGEDEHHNHNKETAR
jgi:F-type H+-transporting ATPase subunit a